MSSSHLAQSCTRRQKIAHDQERHARQARSAEAAGAIAAASGPCWQLRPTHCSFLHKDSKLEHSVPLMNLDR